MCMFCYWSSQKLSTAAEQGKVPRLCSCYFLRSDPNHFSHPVFQDSPTEISEQASQVCPGPWNSHHTVAISTVWSMLFHTPAHMVLPLLTVPPSQLPASLGKKVTAVWSVCAICQAFLVPNISAKGYSAHIIQHLLFTGSGEMKLKEKREKVKGFQKENDSKPEKRLRGQGGD